MMIPANKMLNHCYSDFYSETGTGRVQMAAIKYRWRKSDFRLKRNRKIKYAPIIISAGTDNFPERRLRRIGFLFQSSLRGRAARLQSGRLVLLLKNYSIIKFSNRLEIMRLVADAAPGMNFQVQDYGFIAGTFWYS